MFPIRFEKGKMRRGATHTPEPPQAIEELLPLYTVLLLELGGQPNLVTIEGIYNTHNCSASA